MSSAENDRIQEYFRGTFPILAPDEALIEGAFTPESHRGLGIMPRAMALIAERATDFGARYVLTFVGEDNIPSLKGCKRAGFAPYMLRKTDWRLLRPRANFLPLPEDKPYPVNQEKAISKASWSTSARLAGRTVVRSIGEPFAQNEDRLSSNASAY
jgi:hypothetical protein